MSKNRFTFNRNNSVEDANTGYQKEWNDYKRSKRHKSLKRAGIFLGIFIWYCGYYILYQLAEL